MSTTVKAYGVTGPKEPLKPLTIERRAPDDNDVVIDIKYAGICHSDIHTIRGVCTPRSSIFGPSC